MYLIVTERRISLLNWLLIVHSAHQDFWIYQFQQRRHLYCISIFFDEIIFGLIYSISSPRSYYRWRGSSNYPKVILVNLIHYFHFLILKGLILRMTILVLTTVHGKGFDYNHNSLHLNFIFMCWMSFFLHVQMNKKQLFVFCWYPLDR